MIKLKEILKEYKFLVKLKSGKFELKPDFEKRVSREHPLEARASLAYYGWAEAGNKNFQKLDKIYRNCLKLVELIGFTSELKKLIQAQEKDFYRQMVRTYAEYDEIYKRLK
tara:strand:+ start:129 stop:461 length:333 start_codon:yes stop_codon:yes gene_type:complete